MRERPQLSAVARRVPIEAYPSPGKGGGGDGYQRPQRQPQRQQQQQQQQEQPPRPHSYIGFSRPDSYGGNLDFYSNRYNRNANRYTPGNSGSLFKSTLRHNKSSNDLLSSERTDVCASPSLYRELLNGSPSPSYYRELVNPSPALTFTGRLASREISPLRSQSVLSNRSNLQYNFRGRKGGDNTRDTTPNRQSNIYNNRYNNQNRSTSHDRQADNETNNTYRNVDDTSFGLTQDKGKRKSSTGVTFALPDDGNSSDEQTSVYGQFSISAAAYRRMSAPELPPIANNNTGKGGNNKTPRGDKRKTSTNSLNSTGSKASINQLAAAVNSKTYYNRKASTDGSTTGGGTTNAIKKGKKKKLPIPRNHSDSSLKNLVANTSSQSQESGSTVHSYPTAAADGGGGSSSGGGGGPRGVKFLSNGHRALSWCATDNSGSQTKLETLFERQVSGNVENHNSNNNNINNNSGSNNNLNNLTIPATSNNTPTPTANNNNNNNNNSLGGRITYSPLGNPITKASSSNSISNLPYNNSSNSLNNITDMPAIVSRRSVSVNGIRSKEDIKRLEAMNQKLISENGDVEIDTVDEFVSRGRMRRSNSENKLAGKSHQRNSTTSHPKQQQHKPSQRSLSRNLSVDRIDRLTSKPQRKNPIPSRTGANSKLRRVSSVTNLQNNRKNNRATFNDENNEEEVFEDEESIEASARLVEWLNVVNNVDEYDTDPKDTIVEYSDEPPQTDTAVHVVYEGE